MKPEKEFRRHFTVNKNTGAIQMHGTSHQRQAMIEAGHFARAEDYAAQYHAKKGVKPINVLQKELQEQKEGLEKQKAQIISSAKLEAELELKDRLEAQLRAEIEQEFKESKKKTSKEKTSKD